MSPPTAPPADIGTVQGAIKPDLYWPKVVVPKR